MKSMKQKLISRELVIGTMVSEMRIPAIARMLDAGGMDFMILDAEHGPFSYESLADIAAVAAGSRISCLSRIPEISRETIMKPLDVGMDGIIIPQIEEREQVRQVIEYAKYPPMGHRGVALRRGHSGYVAYPAKEYLEKANNHTIIAVQIESQAAVDHVEEIISVPGIDIAFVGPFDLSVSMGIPGELEHADLHAAIHRVIEACKRCHVVAGLMQFNINSARKWINEGIRFMVYSSDVNMITDQAAEHVRALRS